VTQKQIKKRVSKDDWLKAALEMLSESGIESVKIEKLAKYKPYKGDIGKKYTRALPVFCLKMAPYSH
jgi:hypothetical protein